MSEKGYIGKIPNSGNMDVKAPHQQTCLLYTSPSPRDCS